MSTAAQVKPPSADIAIHDILHVVASLPVSPTIVRIFAADNPRCCANVRLHNDEARAQIPLAFFDIVRIEDSSFRGAECIALGTGGMSEHGRPLHPKLRSACLACWRGPERNSNGRASCRDRRHLAGSKRRTRTKNHPVPPCFSTRRSCARSKKALRLWHKSNGTCGSENSSP